ncbi:hypothetical protein [Herbaspirillum sp. ST 5-3]|uniref:hypothetical protein n=1 Tax=Oxalobacteraceae TaxID=75682 RepID=UPI0010A51F3E|nr:hypothetical protein [Herbaspirillum sp. ST 5-3]
MKSIVWITTALGVLVGVSPVINSSAPAMIVGGLVGAGFGAPVGVAIFASILAVRRRKWGRGGKVGMSRNESQQDCQPYSPMMTADEWGNYRQQFPFNAAGDTDPLTKTMTGWRDASDIHYTRDIAS